MSAPVKIPHAEYLARPEISNSLLQRVGQSPAHAKEYLDHPQEPTPAMLFGSMAHSGILEPEIFNQSYVVMPKFDGRTNVGKQAKLEFAEANHGRIAVTDEQFNTVLGMIESVYNHTQAHQLLSAGESELSYFHERLKCRPDHINGNILIDLKTTVDASYKEFQRSVVNFGYSEQASFYIDLIKLATGQQIEQFVLIAVEKTAPFAVATYVLDDLAIQSGRAKYRANLSLWVECLRTGIYPAYGDELVSMGLPGWAV